MTRVLLIQAPLGRREPPVLPIGLAWLAAGLPAGWPIRIHDPNVDDTPVEAVVAAFRPDVVGLSLRNIDTTQYKDPYCFFEHFPPFVRRVKACVAPGVPVVVGGAGFSLFGDAVMQRVPELDLGVNLEGELTFPRLLGALDQPQSVPGVYYRREGVVHFTGPGPRADLSELRPRLDLVDIPRYAPYDGNYAIGIQTKRGCVLQCAYCTYVLLSGNRLRLRNPVHVVDEVELYVKEHGVKKIFFADAVFNLPPAHARAIAEEIVRRKLEVRWRAYHNERAIDADYMRLAVESGCTEFTFSPDAWAPQTLSLLQKNVGPADILRSLELVRDTPGAVANYNFMIGLPGQDLRELAGILKFWAHARRRLGKRLQGFRLAYVRVEPGTALHATLRADDDVDALLPQTEADLRGLFQTRTGHRSMDLFCTMTQVHLWPLSRRPQAQVGDERRSRLRGALHA